jgi:hypothetical protein
MNKQNGTLVIGMEPGITEQQFLDKMEEYSIASIQVVGVDSTYKALDFLVRQINESPDTYRKIFHPAVLEKFEQLAERNASGSKMGTFEIMALVGELMEVLK